MKLLRVKPFVPPYLHLGSVLVEVLASDARRGKGWRLIEEAWQLFSFQLVADPQRLREILKRKDDRSADPSYTHDACEVFCTVTDDGHGQALIDFYL